MTQTIINEELNSCLSTYGEVLKFERFHDKGIEDLTCDQVQPPTTNPGKNSFGELDHNPDDNSANITYSLSRYLHSEIVEIQALQDITLRAQGHFYSVKFI